MAFEPGSSNLTTEDARQLLRLATLAIERELTAPRGTEGNAAAEPEPDAWSATLQCERATFVTLRRSGELRGCCGSIQAHEPLGRNVVRSAVAAAVADRRFPPLTLEELPEIELHVSVLNPPQPLSFLTEADLIAQLHPGVDGVVLVERELRRQGVFLPAVWEQLPDAREFVRRLKLKAGLPIDYWSPWLAASRFTVESVHGWTLDWLADRATAPHSEGPAD